MRGLLGRGTTPGPGGRPFRSARRVSGLRWKRLLAVHELRRARKARRELSALQRRGLDDLREVPAVAIHGLQQVRRERRPHGLPRPEDEQRLRSVREEGPDPLHGLREGSERCSACQGFRLRVCQGCSWGGFRSWELAGEMLLRTGKGDAALEYFRLARERVDACYARLKARQPDQKEQQQLERQRRADIARLEAQMTVARRKR
jgi:hypothetical protein